MAVAILSLWIVVLHYWTQVESAILASFPQYLKIIQLVKLTLCLANKWGYGCVVISLDLKLQVQLLVQFLFNNWKAREMPFGLSMSYFSLL